MNLLAGLAIGIANTSWLAVIVVSLTWPFIFCAYVSMLHTQRTRATIADFQARGRRLLFDSPVLTFYAIEFVTALFTVLPVAILSHFARTLFV
jgi:hypothetical protein